MGIDIEKLFYFFLGTALLITVSTNLALSNTDATKVERIDNLSLEVYKHCNRQKEDKNIGGDIFEVECNWTDLAYAMAWVESRLDTTAYNEKEKAIGYLQIRPIFVRELNRKLGYTKYSHEDARSKEGSLKMFEDYILINNLKSYEKVARTWNGGPNGMNKSSTVVYWNKVKNKLGSLK